MLVYGLCTKTSSDGTVTTVRGVQLEDSSSRITNKTAGYSTRRKTNRWLAPLYYGTRRQVWSYSQGSFTDTVKATGKFSQSWSGVLDNSILSYVPGPEFPAYDFPQEMKSRLSGKIDNAILLKIKDSKINLAQAFAERQQTVGLIQTTALRLAAGYRSLRSGNLAGFAHSIGMQPPSLRRQRAFSREHLRHPILGASGAWLEYAYGWTPLLSDVYAAVDIVFPKPVQPLNVQSSASERMQGSSLSTAAYINSTLSWDSTLRYRKKIFYELDDSAASSLYRSASQIGLTNPALLAWELMPYSFVVDWFVPVGSYLSTFDATLGLKFKAGIFDDKWIRRASRVSVGTGASSPSSVSTTGGCTSEYSDLWFERKILGSFPSPSLPSIKNPLSTQHALSAISLLSQTFLRRT